MLDILIPLQASGRIKRSRRAFEENFVILALRQFIYPEADAGSNILKGGVQRLVDKTRFKTGYMFYVLLMRLLRYLKRLASSGRRAMVVCGGLGPRLANGMAS